MKTREEQIKEMAQCMCGAKDSDICQNSCSKACGVWKYAERAIAVGYRKQSDTVREFVERVKEVYDKEFYHRLGGYDIFDLWSDIIYLAAEEYGAEVEE